MKPEAFPAKTAALVPYVKEDFFVKDKKNTPQVLARRALLVLLDAAIVAFSFYFALLLRADGAVEAAWWPHNRELLYENLPWIVAVYIASFLFSGLYSVLWKYAGERDLMRLAAPSRHTISSPRRKMPRSNSLALLNQNTSADIFFATCCKRSSS